jgi:uncharacterized delta-60 repeat protein
MPYVIDSITAETININREVLIKNQKLALSSYFNNGDSSENTNINWSKGVIQEINIDDDPTLTFENGFLGQTTTLLLKQQLGGLRFINWPNNVIWNGGNSITLQTLPSVGGFDDSFIIGTGFNSFVESSLIQPDGKIIVVGNFTQYNGGEANRIIRLNPDGSVDNTFIGTGFNSSVGVIESQLDGKILVGGSFTRYEGDFNYNVNRIIRLNSDGSIDTSFNPGDGFNSFVTSITVQPDEKIIVTGNFTTYNGVLARNIVRLNPDGSFDVTFGLGLGFDSFGLNTTAIQSDGKILVGGFFTTYNGIASSGIVRLNSNGSFDSTFMVGGGFDNIPLPNKILIQPDGKILAVGYFTSYDNLTTNYIVRLNSNGSIDDTFNVGGGFDSTALSLTIQPDGKIIVVGDFTTYDGVSKHNIVRLNPDGSIDNTFDVGTGFFSGEFFGSTALTVSIQSDGNIIVGGVFTNYNGNSSSNLVRLIGQVNAYDVVRFDYNGTNYIGSY